jgi:hypothetical protein
MKKNTDSEFLLISIRDNVDKLSLPYKQEVLQETDGPEVLIEKRTILLKPLLVQLQEAIGSSQSVVSRGGGDMSTRSVLDASALMLQTDIEEDLRQLWMTVFAPSRKARPVENTRAVRQLMVQVNKLVLDKRIENEELWNVHHIFDSWVHQIETKFDPPVVIEITRPCPKCHESFVYDEFNDRILAMVVEWRKSFEASSAQCRACGQTWLGQTELRQMRYDLDQLDEELDFSDTPEQED